MYIYSALWLRTLTRHFKRYNLELYKQDLAKILEKQPQDDDPSILWEDWKRKFLLVADMHAPPVTRRVPK